jgi:hypothetical protein
MACGSAQNEPECRCGDIASMNADVIFLSASLWSAFNYLFLYGLTVMVLDLASFAPSGTSYALPWTLYTTY